MSSLSLLSRGAGQVAQKEQEKLEVHFDPEDYLNWTSPETRCRVSKLLGNCQDTEESWRIGLPKTYSTRKGALILYSEDLAKPSRKWEEHRKPQSRVRTKSQTLQIELHTLQDLARAILAYGGKQVWKGKKGSAWQPYLHFLSDPESWTDREMRPGYSAKRYLLKLSQTLSPNFLQKLQREGYIRDPFLLEESSRDHRQRPQDLSAVPPKYNLLHIYCAPWAYLQAELEEQQTHPGVGPSSQKQAERRARLLEEGYEGKQSARGMTQIPLRISVRKLSFHFRQPQTKETTWSQNIAYKGIPGNRWAKVPPHKRTIQEDVDHCEIPKQGVENSLENTSIAASELWCEKSCVTFYKGILPGRKLFYGVTQRHLKNPDGKEKMPSVDPGLFPPVQTETHSECDGINKKYMKQVPQILQLPQISEDSPRAPLGETKSNELSKELVILPLLVHMRKKTQPKTENLTETSWTVSKSVACAEQLAPLQKDLNFQLEHRNEPQKRISGRLPKAAKDSFCLPPINNGELPWNGRKTKKKEAPASEKASKDQREIPKDTSLSSLLMGPKRETVSPSLLGPVQTTDDPLQFGYVPDNEGEDQVLTKGKIASRCPPETTVVEELDEKEAIQLFAVPKNRSSALCGDRSLELPQTPQAGKPQRKRNGLGKQQSVMGNESFSTQFGKENQQSHGGLCRNSCLQESKEEGRHLDLTQTERLQQKNGADFAQDTKKPLGNFPLSADLTYLEPHVALPTISEWEMESVTPSNNIIVKLLDHSEEIEESMRIDTWSTERHLETEERVALPEKSSNKAKVIRLNRTGGIIENKQMTKQKKRDSMTTGSLSKAQKKRPKKEHKNQVLVVGKPRQKKATGKTDAHFKEKIGGVRRSETSDEPNKVEEKREDATEEQFGPFEEEEEEEEEGGGRRGGEGEEEVEKDDDGLGSTSDPSRPLSSPSKEAEPSLPEESQPIAEDVGLLPHRPAFPLHIFTENASLATAVQSGGLPEDVSAKKEEAKLLRERMIAERAEKRRLTVEKKRREQEELKRKEQEQQERMERMKEEMEQEQQRRTEEMRLRKQQLEEERQRQEEETERKQQAEKAAQERIWQQQEEHRRKILEMQKKKQEEEKERTEAEKRRQKEQALWLEEERRRLAEMAEGERVEYEKKKREEEAKARQEAEEKRKREEEAARNALEEARRHALALAREKEELEKQQQLHYKLLMEATGLKQGQGISRPWVYSYFQHPYLKVRNDD